MKLAALRSRYHFGRAIETGVATHSGVELMRRPVRSW
jgi:hypothetical protein